MPREDAIGSSRNGSSGSGGNTRESGRRSDVRTTPSASPSSQPTTPTATAPTIPPEFMAAINSLAQQLLGTGSGDVATGLSQLFNLAGTSGNAAQNLFDIGLGNTTDPRFAALRGQTLQEQGSFLNRSGLGGSSAAANQLARVSSGLNTQEMGFRSDALSNASALAGQTSNLVGQGISGRTAGIETMSLPIQLRIAMEAAQNAGKDVNGDSGNTSIWEDLFSGIL